MEISSRKKKGELLCGWTTKYGDKQVGDASPTHAVIPNKKNTHQRCGNNKKHTQKPPQNVGNLHGVLFYPFFDFFGCLAQGCRVFSQAQRLDAKELMAESPLGLVGPRDPTLKIWWKTLGGDYWDHTTLSLIKFLTFHMVGGSGHLPDQPGR